MATFQWETTELLHVFFYFYERYHRLSPKSLGSLMVENTVRKERQVGKPPPTSTVGHPHR